MRGFLIVTESLPSLSLFISKQALTCAPGVSVQCCSEFIISYSPKFTSCFSLEPALEAFRKSYTCKIHVMWLLMTFSLKTGMIVCYPALTNT